MNDWSLQEVYSPEYEILLSKDMLVRLQIEKTVSQATKALYENPSTSNGLCSQLARQALVNFLDTTFAELGSNYMSDLTRFHLLCAHLHVRLSSLFDELEIKDNVLSLLNLYETCSSVITLANELERSMNLYAYCTNPLFQMILAAAFAVLTLLSSSFSEYVNVEAGHKLYNLAVTAIKKISVTNNDLPARLAEVLAQMWRRGNRPMCENDGKIWLSVRCRMSVSVVYSCLWTWRDTVQARERIDPTEGSKPTNPEFLQNAAASLSASRTYVSPAASGSGAYPNTVPGGQSLHQMAESQEMEVEGRDPANAYDPVNMMLSGLVGEFPG
jgi:hypothetical protein